MKRLLILLACLNFAIFAASTASPGFVERMARVHNLDKSRLTWVIVACNVKPPELERKCPADKFCSLFLECNTPPTSVNLNKPPDGCKQTWTCDKQSDQYTSCSFDFECKSGICNAFKQECLDAKTNALVCQNSDDCSNGKVCNWYTSLCASCRWWPWCS